MVLHGAGEPLRLEDLPEPVPAEGQVLIRVEACAVCRTDLHVVDGELDDPHYPIVPGHQIVGTVTASRAPGIATGLRVGVPWLGRTCGACGYCASGRENLCGEAKFTGYSLPGGFADSVAADGQFCFPLDAGADPAAVSPLLCAGLIGYRALRMCGDAERIGLFGFGAAAHVLAQVIAWQGRRFHAFTRTGDSAAQDAARDLGADWAGDSGSSAPESLDAAIIFAPVGNLVPEALRQTARGGTVVCAGIHMSDIPSFPYSLLWGERQVRSVANLTRADGIEFLDIATRIPVATHTTTYPLEEANRALDDLRHGRFTGSAVLTITD